MTFELFATLINTAKLLFHQVTHLLTLLIQTQMSIYSGLATREDQRHYNNLLVKLLKTMQQHILEIGQGFIESKFAYKYHQLIAKMQAYEQHKYLPPKYSMILGPIVQAVKASRNRYQSSDLSIKLIEVKEEDEIPSARSHPKRNQQHYKVNGLKSQSGINRVKKQMDLLCHSSVKNVNNPQRRSHSMFGDIYKETQCSWKSTSQSRKPVNQMPLKQIDDIETQNNYRAKGLPLKSRYRRSKIAPIYKEIQRSKQSNFANRHLKTEEKLVVGNQEDANM